MKKKVALFANGWNGENLDNFIVGLNNVFEKEDIDIFTFISYASFSQDVTDRIAENAIFDLPNYSDFDAAIIYSSGLNSDEKFEAILNKCKAANIPVVVQGTKLDGVSTVTINNYVGMRELCDHLVEKHDVKDVVFIAGSKDNPDSNLRLKALKDSFEAHNLPFSDENVVYANWELLPVRYFVFEHYYDRKEKLPDAFVCANDPMALFATLSLEGIGYKVPDDVLVTGFDNLNDGRLFYPAISSVDQCFTKQGEESARFILNQLEDMNCVEDAVINCVAVYGESCGCENCKSTSEIRQILGHDMLSKRYDNENLRGRLARLENSFMSSEDYDEVPQKIRNSLRRPGGMEGKDFHIYVNPQFRNMLHIDTQEKDVLSQEFSPVMETLMARVDGECSPSTSLNTRSLMAGYTGEGENKVYVFAPLRISCYLLGYIVMGYAPSGFLDNRYFYFTEQLDKTLDKFQRNIKSIKLNERLSELMQKDSLTSVKNRIAYDRYMKSVDKDIALDGRKDIAIVMCDINNLKTINDNFGHDAGDVYIKNCCKVMCQEYKHSPVFRIGGDEFVIILSSEDYENRKVRVNEIKQKIEEIANTESSPLNRVSFAIGMAEFDPAIDRSIYDTVKRADGLMYINKAEIKMKL